MLFMGLGPNALKELCSLFPILSKQLTMFHFFKVHKFKPSQVPSVKPMDIEMSTRNSPKIGFVLT